MVPIAPNGSDPAAAPAEDPLKFMVPVDEKRNLEILRKAGPETELKYFDQKSDQLKDLSFEEFVRFKQLREQLGAWDNFQRFTQGGREALSGLWDQVKEVAKEGNADKGFFEKRWRQAMTTAEILAQGSYDFSDLVEGGMRTIGGKVMASMQPTAEKALQVEYGTYKERQKARRFRSDLGDKTILGTAGGGMWEAARPFANTVLSGIGAQEIDTDGNDIQEAIAGSVDKATAGALSMIAPTNLANWPLFGLGGITSKLGRLPALAASASGKGLGKFAGKLSEVTDLGRAAQWATKKVNPGIADESLARVGKYVRRGAMGTGVLGGIGIGTDSDPTGLGAIASAYSTWRTGLSTIKGVSDFTRVIGKHAQQTGRFQSTLERALRDPTTPPEIARVARILHNAKVTPLVRGAKVVGAGVLGGAAEGAAEAAITGSDDIREFGGAAVTEAAVGTALTGLGAAHAKVSGKDTGMRVDAERLLVREAQREISGDDGVAAFDRLPRNEQLAVGMVGAAAGPTARIEVLSADKYKAESGNSGAGVHIKPRTATEPSRILINADANRSKGQTAFHEFTHHLAARKAPAEIKALYDTFATQAERTKFATDYLAGYARDSGLTPEAARDQLTRDNPNWESQEWFAEKGSQILYGANWAKIFKKGSKAEQSKWTELALRAKRAVLENAGVAFDSTGQVVEPEFISDSFKGQDDSGLDKVLHGYIKELADYSPVLDGAVETNASADSGKGPPINFGRDHAVARNHPAFANTWERNPQTGLMENDFAQIVDDTVVLKDQKQISAVEAQREAELKALFAGHAMRAPVDFRVDPTLTRRADGSISGTVLPDSFKQSPAFSDRIKGMAGELERVMNTPIGESLEHWYHQIGSGKGNSNRWAAAVRAKLGNVRASFREIRPINFEVTEAGNLTATVLDLTALKSKLINSAREGKLPLWRNNADDFLKDLKSVMANWSQGVGGDVGVGSQRHQAVLEFLGKDKKGRSLIKTFRVDRMEDVKATGRTGWTFDYGQFKAESPKPQASPDLPAKSKGQMSPDVQGKKRKQEFTESTAREIPRAKGEKSVILPDDDQTAKKGVVEREVSARAGETVERANVARGSKTTVEREQEGSYWDQSARQRARLEEALHREGLPIAWEPPESAEEFSAGGEHSVWKDGNKIFKETHPGSYGYIPRYNPDPKSKKDWGLAYATPAEYLERTALVSQFSKVSARVVGMNDGNIATEHQFVAAADPDNPHPTEETIEKNLTDDGYIQISKGGWFNPESGLMIADAVPRNFIETKAGPVAIDLMMLRPEGELLDVVLEKASDPPSAAELRQMSPDLPPRKGNKMAPEDGAAAEDPTGPTGVGRHELQVERGERVVTTPESVPMTKKEMKAVGKAGKKLAGKKKKDPAVVAAKTAELEKAIRETKAQFPETDGWKGPLEFTGLDPAGKPVFKNMPYEFAQSSKGKPLKKGSKEYESRTDAMGHRMADEVRTVLDRAERGDAAAQKILSQASWYKAMRTRLRREFGGLGDLFADLLGATSPNTPVRDNWFNAVDAMRRATKGDFDHLIPEWEKWVDEVDDLKADLRKYVNEQLAAGKTKISITGKAAVKKKGKVIKEAVPGDPAYLEKLEALKERYKLGDDLLPSKESGKLYGFNGRNIVRAMVDLWRTVKAPEPIMGEGGTAPKALNFSGNLIGFRQGATIDVWAARMLQRIGGLFRIPIPAEGSVTGNMLPSGETTLSFGFGQDVFAKAVDIIRNDPVLSAHENLKTINPDDLQAIVWFVEKELWAKNNWTTEEGGSFEFEADLTGTRDQKRVRELRKVIDSTKTTPAQKSDALKELDSLKREADRYFAGLSLEREGDIQGETYVPTDADQARAMEQLHTAAYETDAENNVLAVKVASTEGRYGSIERSIDLEVVARDGFDPNPMWQKQREIAAKEKQDSTFLARILRTDERVDPLFHRPGIEIFFREGKTGEAMEAALQKLNEFKGAGLHTVVVDPRPIAKAKAGEMPPAVGVRIMRLPEYDVRFGIDESWAGLDDAAIAKKVQESYDELLDLADDLIQGNPDVNSANAAYYEVRTEFAHEYAHLRPDRPAEGATRPADSAPWRGRTVSEAVDAANIRPGTPEGEP